MLTRGRPSTEALTHSGDFPANNLRAFGRCSSDPNRRYSPKAKSFRLTVDQLDYLPAAEGGPASSAQVTLARDRATSERRDVCRAVKIKVHTEQCVRADVLHAPVGRSRVSRSSTRALCGQLSARGPEKNSHTQVWHYIWLSVMICDKLIL